MHVERYLARQISHSKMLLTVLDDIVEGHDSSRSAYDSAPMQQYLDESFQAGAIGSYFDEESDVGSLPDLAQRLQRKIATFFNGGSRKPLDSSAHHNVVLLDYPKEEKNDQRSYFVNYSDEVSCRLLCSDLTLAAGLSAPSLL